MQTPQVKPLNLIEHPEGGRYQEVFRSNTSVSTADSSVRSTLTHIYFSLNPDEKSHFHKVNGDEVWNFYKGKGLYLYLWDGTHSKPQRITLSPEENQFCYVIPSGMWQAAEPIQDKVLVGCSVAPGFEFTGFELLSSTSEEGQRLLSIAPNWQQLVLS
ncbi:MAG: cupin domain-containing protein [Merismopedia sp. SIO2A8]|nr:cupin domain-containing protein [Symploca sp. SIO2B6]NET53845.1 cupin domain-containing protein [Merismopedia sp. SIO2A8]